MLTVVLCALIGAVANRFSGWTNQSWIPGRHIYWAALALFLISYFTLGIGWALAVFVSALTYRIPGWYGSLDMGLNEGSLKRDAQVMFACTFRIAPVFIWAAFRGVWFAPLLLPVAAAGAVAMYVFGNYVGKKFTQDPFRYVEPGVGAVLGAAIGVAIICV
jgi:hypothetical protein